MLTRKPNVWRMLALVMWGLSLFATSSAKTGTSYATKSGILPWVDVATPTSAKTYTSSRGDKWTLTMSDEFNVAGRSFKAGVDHMWTAMEIPDGVNSALEVYSINMTGTKCDDDGNCYFFINTTDETISETVWNSYISPPGYQTVNFYYRSGMVQSWNKFCFQGGMIEVRVQLPGAVTNASGNPDVKTGSTTVRAANVDYYPTWPGIWLMGNLSRALFTASTNRMWPCSYNECNETVFDPQNQRISSCNASPGPGVNANQGRGAPEIDILEGGGTAISSSVQVGPGMPGNFRMMKDNTSASSYCYYSYICTTEGANNQDVPTEYYKQVRGHKSWYQGLRYGANNICDVEPDDIQTFATINASLSKGITENACTMQLCPASYDVNADMGYKDNGTEHWGINANGTCFPMQNAYMGHTYAVLATPRRSAQHQVAQPAPARSLLIRWTPSPRTGKFTWARTWTGSRSLEWVTGDSGYIRWEVEGQVIFEIPAEAITNPPQDAAQMNPKKIMIEEPMYVLFNVALSKTWGSKPPHATSGGEYYGDGSSSQSNAICDSFPMYLKIDYIRLYQDTSSNTDMAIGCDPSSHPTKQWIEDNIDDYTNSDNPYTAVSGMTFCKSDNDCTINIKVVSTGTCSSKGRCKCSSKSWTGPRCTEVGSSSDTKELFGPPMLASGLASTALVITYQWRVEKRFNAKFHQEKLEAVEASRGASKASASESSAYRTNFV